MGLIGRIRSWWGRRWMSRAEYERRFAEGVRAALDGYRQQVEGVTSGEMHTLQEDLVRKEGEILLLVEQVKVLAERPSADELSRDLANILTGHGLVGCRIEALRDKLGIGVLRTDGKVVGWGITGDGLDVYFEATAGHGPGCCSLCVDTPGRSVRLPVTPKMSRNLLDFLERLYGVPAALASDEAGG